MTEAQEIAFWKQAKKLIRKGYGKSCKEFEWECAGCRANLVVKWIESHLELL